MNYRQHLLFTKNEAVNQGGGRKERGHPKIAGKSFIKICEVIWRFASYKSTKNVT